LPRFKKLLFSTIAREMLVGSFDDAAVDFSGHLGRIAGVFSAHEPAAFLQAESRE